MRKLIVRILKVVGVVVVLAAAIGGIYAYTQIAAFNASMDKVYDVAPLAVVHSTDPAVIARGKHLGESIAGCAIHDCHGSDLGGGSVTEVGPIGTIRAPNATQIMPAYSDGELARLIRHGLKKDGRSVRLMTMQDVNWLPDDDLVALVSWLRTVPPVERTTGTTEVKPLGKILDRKNLMPFDVARRIDHAHIELGPAPSATAAYGAYIARLCTGCHGEKLSGGHLPGTPSDFPTPLNLTPDATGLKGWTYDDFTKLADTGVRKNGHKLASFMPIEALHNMDDTEKHALFAYLESVPPVAFGNR